MSTTLNPDDFPSTLTVTSVSSSVVASVGGEEIVLTETFKGSAAVVGRGLLTEPSWQS